MRYPLLFLIVLSFTKLGFAQAQQRLVLYLIPGTGADERLFHALDLSAFDTVNIKLPIATSTEDMAGYAARIAKEQVDTTRPFAIMGVSLGGMVATELADLLNPEAVIIIASAKTRQELPAGYRLNQHIPFHKLIGGRTMRWTSKAFQPIYEPMADEQRDLFVQMISAKEPAFLNQAIRLIVEWDREDAPAGIIHIHGTKDRTLPYRCVDATHSVVGGTHMITYSQPERIEGVIAEVFTAKL